MPVPGTLSRRKPTTYGKRSRTHAPDLSPAAGDEFGRVPTQSGQDAAKQIQIRIPGSQIPSNRIINSMGHNGVKKMAEAYAPNVLKPSPRERQTGKNGQNNVYAPLKSSPISPNSDPDTLYDIPSSDEECRGKLGPHGPTVGKRRKITSIMEPKEITYVYDDETLQRHVAAEVYINSKRSFDNEQNTEKRRLPSIQDHTKKSDREIVDPALKNRQVFLKADCTSKPSQPLSNNGLFKVSTNPNVSGLQLRKGRNCNVQGTAKIVNAKTKTASYKPPRSSEDTKMSFKRRHEPVEKAGEVTRPKSKDLDIEFSCFANATPLRQPRTPPHTPPRSLGSADGVVTPRQRQLWDMLLKDDARIASPSDLDLPKLKIRDSTVGKAWDYRVHREITKDGTRPKPPMQKGRRRLVDNLQRNDKSNSSDSTDGKTASDDDNAFGNDQYRTPPEDSILAINASQIVNEPRNGEQARKPAFPKAVQPLSQAGALKVTYARQRSYLTDDGLGDATMFGESIMYPTAAEATNERRRVRATVAERGDVKNSHDETDEFECSQGGTMRSIHELREAGGTVRLVSEMEMMLDEIDEKNTGSVTLKRTTLLGLVTKLQEASYCRLFLSQGLELRLLANVGLNNDIIIGSLYAISIWHLLVDPTSTRILPRMCVENVVNHLVGLIDNDQDLSRLLRDRKLNMSKLAQLDFKHFFDSLLTSANWRADNPPTLTPRVLCLQCLEYLVRQTREIGSEAEVLQPHDMRQIVKTLKQTTPSLTQPPTIALTTDLRLAVSVLESCTLSNAFPISELLWTGETLDTVIGLLPLLVPITDQASGALQTLVLRLYLNLTNNSPELCKAFSRPNLTIAMFDIVVSHFGHLSDNITSMEQPMILDNLILSLGFLLNLAEWCDDLGHLVQDLWYGDVTFLDCLLEIFTAKLGKAGEVSIPSANINR